MIELSERIYHSDGTTKDVSKQFSSKRELVKVLKKSSLPTKAIYDLTKTNEADFFFEGAKRNLKIVESEG